MNREEAKKLLPIIQAYSDGKTIQSRCIKADTSLWYDDDTLSFDDDFEYRIKPEAKYRPFANAEECWAEMLRHEPFGVVKDKYYAKFQVYRSFTTLLVNGCNFRGYEDSTFLNNFNNLLFADGSPFGIKVEE